METAACYSEAKIKTYGFEIRLNQCLCEFNLAPDPLSGFPHWYADGQDPAIPFEMVFMGPMADDRWRLSIVLATHHRHAFQRWITAASAPSAGIDLRITSPVEVLYFFGPHFGDRYGIAEATFNALAAGNLGVIAACCSGASIFLVLPEQGALKAKAVFADWFEIPRTVQRPTFLTPPRATRPVNRGADS